MGPRPIFKIVTEPFFQSFTFMQVTICSPLIVGMGGMGVRAKGIIWIYDGQTYWAILWWSALILRSQTNPQNNLELFNRMHSQTFEECLLLLPPWKMHCGAQLAHSGFVSMMSDILRPLLKGETLKKWFCDIFENRSRAHFQKSLKKGFLFQTILKKGSIFKLT